MKEILMMRGARKLVEECTGIQAGERVLVVADMTKVSIAKVVASASFEQGAEVVLIFMEPRKKAGEEPPVNVAAAMATSDVIFSVVGYSITHTRAVKEAVARGARILVMTDFNEDMMISGGIEANFKAIQPVCKGLADAFTRGNKVHLTTPGGTDLWMDATGRRGNALYCIVKPGEFSTVPTIEANFSPTEDSAEGVIVCDASIPYLGIGLMNESLTAIVKKGYITELLGGGKQGDRLRQDLESHKDHNVYNIAELGVGLNPQCRMCGLMLEDEGVQSTAHIGIGTSLTLGGIRKAPIHYDLIMWHPTVTVDGQVVIEGKEVRL